MSSITSVNDDVQLRSLRDVVLNAPPVKPLWGDLLFTEALTFITGEAGVCKTTLGYNLGFHIIEGKEFLGYKPMHPCNVAYFDFESGDALIGSRCRLINGDDFDEFHEGFYIFNRVGIYLPEIITYLPPLLKERQIGLVIIDNQSTAFPTRDENDNTEGRKEMQAVRYMLREAECAGILFHHPGKANQAGLNKGRGASSRPAHADIVCNVSRYIVGSSEDKSEYLQLSVEKNRYTDDRRPITFIKEEGKFVRIETPPGVELDYAPADPSDFVRHAILNSLNAEGETPTSAILALPECQRVSSVTVYAELNKLQQFGLIERPKFGKYRLRRANQILNS